MFCGPVFDQSAGSMIKTDATILDTPRSVSVVTSTRWRPARCVGSTFAWGFGDPGPDVNTPSYTPYDAMLGYSWDRYRISLTGRNLADKT